ncbi:MAG: DUF2029 domain-containing protein [Caulobacteraceae bacterium]|nr:DUF2029 domain-containing protein [Caulobacteraceae bacterium]
MSLARLLSPAAEGAASVQSRMAQRAALALLALVLWGGFAFFHAKVKPADFYVFWAAARHWQAPYDPAVIAQLQASLHIDGAWPFVYPPTFLLVAWPFGLAPAPAAYAVWTGLSAALFTFAAAGVVRPPWAAAALFIVPPVVLAVSPGQTSLLVGAAMAGGFEVLRSRPRLAGLLFAVAAVIKPQAMILAPIVLWGETLTLTWAAIGGLGLIAASFVFGPGRWVEWLGALRDFQAVIPATDRINPSALLPGWAGTAALALLGVWIAWRSRNLLGLVAGALCLTPYAHQYDLAPLAPPALAWLIDWRRSGWARAAVGGALLAGLVATPVAGLAFVAAAAALPRPRPPAPEASGSGIPALQRAPA